MIAIGSKITLRPNMTYKDAPEKNEDFNYSENMFGKFQQCQVMDINAGVDGNKRIGFFYVRIYSDLPLAVNDVVTVKEIMYVQRKGNICVFAIKIEENPIMSIQGNLKDDVGF